MTQIMHIRKQNQSRSEFVSKLNEDEVLQHASAYKYLCLLLEYMNSSTHTYDLSVRSSKALGCLRTHFCANNGIVFSTFKSLHDVCIANVCDYSASVWEDSTFPKLDSVHSRTLKHYLGVHEYPPLAIVEAEMGFLSPLVWRKLERVGFWNHLIRLNNNRIPRKIFKVEFMNKHSWCLDIKCL